MRKTYLLFLTVCILALFVACGPAGADSTATPESSTPEVEGGEVSPRPTITSAPDAEESETLPGPTVAPADYPPSAPEAQPEAVYPGEGDRVWVVLPVGVQCEEDGPYSTLEEAAAALEEAGVVVMDQTTVELIVPQACGQPTSEHYRIQILAAGLPQAENLDWRLEDE